MRGAIDPVGALKKMRCRLGAKEGVEPSGDREPGLSELLIPREIIRGLAQSCFDILGELLAHTLDRGRGEVESVGGRDDHSVAPELLKRTIDEEGAVFVRRRDVAENEIDGSALSLQ